MSSVVMLLRIEHRRMAGLLDLVGQQATKMARGAPVNHGLLEALFAYLSSYPEQCHHPKEDLVYRKLLARCPEMAGSLNDLIDEHEKLAGATDGLMRDIAGSPRDPPAPDERLADRISDFLDLYRRHMLMEEKHFFPAALQRLSRNDFAEIDFTLYDRPDPVFDLETEDRFSGLREEIARLGAGERAGGGIGAEAALLAALQDVAAFNEAMRRNGEPVFLVRSPQGGYEVRDEGSTLAHIPACSESRAAWCAFFYWKAATPGKEIS
jgi:hemerythrin-like domain-containing protein